MLSCYSGRYKNIHLNERMMSRKFISYLANGIMFPGAEKESSLFQKTGVKTLLTALSVYVSKNAIL